MDDIEPAPLETLDRHALLSLAERIAEATGAGHVSLVNRPDGWRCVFGIPGLGEAGREEVSGTPALPTVEAALALFIRTHGGGG